MIKSLQIVLCSFLLVIPASAFALNPAPSTGAGEIAAKAPNSQQERMKFCNQKAGSLKGEERKKFMSPCLKGELDTPAVVKVTQQEKMKICNKEAGDKALKGEERKTFMSTCLKGSA